MTRTLHGIVNGNTIELSDDLGVPAGQAVEVMVRLLPESNVSTPESNGGDKPAGEFVWTEEDDRILEQIYQQRKNDTRHEIPE